MALRFFKRRAYRRRLHEVAPDEIFLDSKNLPKFDTQQFEGRMERPISKRTVVVLGIFFTIVGIMYVWRLGVLQIARGESYLAQSEKNILHSEPIFADRGIIYDRNGEELASNTAPATGDLFAHRKYIETPGFGHLLGYVSYPTKDKQGFYWQPEFIGKAGVEKSYDNLLAGKNGLRMLETDVHGNVVSENNSNPPVQGSNVTLSIDEKIQEKFYSSLADVAEQANYQGATGMIMNIHTGELISLVSFPEYNPEILSNGDETSVIKGYLSDTRKPFLDRAVGGLYSPGSIIKPFIALGALNEGVIDPQTKILSAGSISIPNPYFPDQPSVFKDYNPNNGWVDMRHALQVSSNIYFYEVGGGYMNQKGIGIDNIGKYTKLFGIGQSSGIDLPGEVTGTIPSPAWKAKAFPGDPWRIGDTYHTAIGQYGFQVTPIEMLRGVTTIANGGSLLTPTVLKHEEGAPIKETKIDLPPDDFQVIRDGMRLVVEGGTAHGLNDLPVKIAAKSGTAQVGVNNAYINSWIMGFFPYDNPQYSFTVLMERGPSTNTIGSLAALKNLFEWMEIYTPEYLADK